MRKNGPAVSSYYPGCITNLPSISTLLFLPQRLFFPCPTNSFSNYRNRAYAKGLDLLLDS